MPVLLTDADTPFGMLVVDRLVATGGQVRAFCSARGDTGALRRRGAIAAGGDVDDVGRLEAACEQVHTVIHLGGGLLSREPAQILVDMESVVTAAQNAGVQRLVFLSVVGADPTSPEPLRRVKGLVEQIASGADLPTVAVRLPILETPALRALIAGTPLPADLRDHQISVVSPEPAADLLVAIDDLRSSGAGGHATLVAAGDPTRLGAWMDAEGPATYRPLGELPFLVEALRGDWTDRDPVPADAWAFTGVAADR